MKTEYSELVDNLDLYEIEVCQQVTWNPVDLL